MNEAALKERLKTIASEKETTLNKIWKQLLLERFLARLSDSLYHDNFIFKGGLLLAQYITINRETVDIAKLTKSIQSTFIQRGTPISFSINFDSSGLQNLQAFWANHLRGLGVFRKNLNFPALIEEVIKEINNWIKSNKVQE